MSSILSAEISSVLVLWSNLIFGMAYLAARLSFPVYIDDALFMCKWISWAYTTNLHILSYIIPFAYFAVQSAFLIQLSFCIDFFPVLLGSNIFIFLFYFDFLMSNLEIVLLCILWRDLWKFSCRVNCAGIPISSHSFIRKHLLVCEI